jgi:2'-5' RNA ligase
MTKTTEKRRGAFWLLPTREDSRQLQEKIDTYADRLGTPRFEPHLTLLVRPIGEIGDPHTTLDRLAETTNPFSLATPGLPQWGPLYNQAFVLPFSRTPELDKLVMSLHPQHQVPNDYFPHISLIYANLDEAQGAQLAREYIAELQTVHFDRIAAIGIGPRCRCDADVAAWEKLATAQLPLKES